MERINGMFSLVKFSFISEKLNGNEAITCFLLCRWCAVCRCKQCFKNQCWAGYNKRYMSICRYHSTHFH